MRLVPNPFFKANTYYLTYFLVAILAVFVYLNTLDHGFVMDDDCFLVKNAFIQNRGISDIFSYEYLTHTWEDLDVKRPLMVASLIIDFSAWKLNPIGYHLTNLILHTANTVILLYMLNLIFRSSRVPFLAALIFAVHPIHIQVVNAINFREDLLVTLFFLLSLSFFIKGCDLVEDKLSFLMSLIFYILALLSKEMALTLPIICWMYLRTRKPIRLPRWVFPGYFIITAIFLLFLTFIKQYSAGMVIIQWSLLERFFGALVILGRYIWLNLFPIGLIADYDDMPFFLITTMNIVSASTVTVLVLWVFRGFIDKLDNKTLFMGWFFVTLIPVMNIVPIFNPIAERYLYLPSVGFITVFVMWWNGIIEKKEKAASMAIIAFIILCSVLTISGNRVWRDDYSLWVDTVKKAPGNSNAHYELGIFYARGKRFDKAYTEYIAALAVAPDNLFFKATIHNSLGELYMKNYKKAEALEEFQTALKLSPLYYEAHINLGMLFDKDMQYDKALAEYEAALRINPKSDRVYHMLGRLYAGMKQHDKAYWAYQKALELNPDNAEVYFSLGTLLFEDSNIQASIAMFRKGLTLSPADMWAHSFLGDLYMKIGERALAEEEYKAARRY